MKKPALLVLALSLAGRTASHRAGSYPAAAAPQEKQYAVILSMDAFREGFRQRSFQNRNINLILCRLLGIEPAPNDGDWREIKRMFCER
ncbi:hypothetical protein [Alistipes sp. i18-0019-D1]|jgi:hypothetical protein|uniref:hypothetical protein n=1 Tax=Alistipes sp. i18-0019-D1 TaxID=3132707 RepID=UPI0036F3E2C0